MPKRLCPLPSRRWLPICRSAAPTTQLPQKRERIMVRSITEKEASQMRLVTTKEATQLKESASRLVRSFQSAGIEESKLDMLIDLLGEELVDQLGIAEDMTDD